MRLHPEDVRAIAEQVAALLAAPNVARKRVDVPASSFEALRQEIARQDVRREERAARRATK